MKNIKRMQAQKKIGKQNDKTPSTGMSLLRDQSGIVLVTALVLLLMLVTLGATAAQWSGQDIIRTKEYTRSRDSFYVAMAGIQNAVNHLNYDSIGDTPGEEIAADGMDAVLNGTLSPATDNFMTNHSALASATFNGGTYVVTLTDNDDNDSNTADDDDNTVLLTSVGTKAGRSTTIDALLLRPLYEGTRAVIAEGDVTLTGAGTSISGTSGSVHANNNLNVSGGATIAQGGSASGATCGAISCTAGAAKEAIPTVEPSDYEQYADYIFNYDGTIDRRNADGSLSTNVGASDTAVSGFSHSSAVGNHGWTATASSDPDIVNVANNKFLYFKDDAKAGNIGSAGTPWNVTIISEKSIDIGNANLTNYKDSTDSEGIQNLFLVAENDIKVGFEQTAQGLLAAKDQIDIGGSASLEGYIIAKNLTTDDNLVQGDAVTIHGGIDIVYNDKLIAPFLSDTVIILSWEEA